MLTRREVITQLDNEYSLARERAAAEAEARRADAEARVPELAQLDADVRRVTLKMARRIAADENADAERAEIAELERMRASLLEKAGIGAETLRPIYRCPRCRDTGRGENGEVCSCYRNELLRRLCADMSADGEGSFETFDLSLFPEENGQREYMRKLRDFALQYAETFPDSPKRVLTLCGEPGLGKTFTVNCMARRILERGFSVLRLTAFGLMDELRAEHTGKSEKHIMPDLIAADLLVIDDLGTEPFYNNITLEYLFCLINERLNAGRHTILSTNFSPTKLRAEYGERIYSRISDSYSGAVLQLSGADLRRRKGKK